MHLYVIAGPNGAGKTTFAREFLPHFAKCQEFINADLIATGLSPFSPNTAAIEAGRMMLNRIHELASRHHTFAFETTLAGRGYLSLFRRLRTNGYEDIRRRFNRGLKNLFAEYLPLLDSWTLLDNSGNHPRTIASAAEGQVQVVISDLFHKIKEDSE